MNDSQIVDLLLAAGFGLLTVNVIGTAAGIPGSTHYAGAAVALGVAAVLFHTARRIRNRAALKRMKRELGDKPQQARIILGGDQ